MAPRTLARRSSSEIPDMKPPRGTSTRKLEPGLKSRPGLRSGLPLGLLSLRIVRRIDVDDVERSLQADLNDGGHRGPGEVVHLRGERHEPARLERLAGLAIQLVAHSHLQRTREHCDALG